MSKLVLVYDTETSGLPLWNSPSGDPDQPHIVQLAACLVNTETWNTIDAMDVIIKPDGWRIPAEVAQIHGITTEHALEVGIPEKDAVEEFLDLWKQSAFRIAHNESFDARILRIALKRFAHAEDSIHVRWQAGPAKCTQRLATPILRLPPTARMRAVGRNHPKSANLREAYQFFTGNELQNAHTAMADVGACIAVYRAICTRGLAA